MRNQKRLVLIIIIISGFTHILYSCFNPNGHDYMVYSGRMKENSINDLPLSWFMMKLSTSIFGNPNGLYILSWLCCLTLYLLYINKIENDDVKITFSLAFFWLYPIWYLSSGVLRNLIGLCFLSFFLLYNVNYKVHIESVILALTHIPTLIVYMFYHLSKKNFKRVLYSILSLCGMVIIGASLNDVILNSAIKPFEMVYYKIINPFYQTRYGFMGKNLWVYMIIVMSFFYYAYLKMDRRKNNNGMMFWILVLLMPFTGIYSYKVMIRFLLYTIIPIFMFIIYDNSSETSFQKIYICVISFISLIVRVI